MSLKIVQGEDRNLSVSLKDENGAAFNLTGYTATAEFCNADGSQLQVAGTVDPAPTNGKVSFSLTNAQTALLDTGTQGFTVTLTDGSSNLRKVNLANSILVEAPLC
jgi:hypothetical protein